MKILKSKKVFYRKVIRLGGSRVIALSKILPEWDIVRLEVSKNNGKIQITLESADARP